MPWCSFPWRKLLPRLAQNNCYTVYSLKLIHEFTFTYIYIRVFNQPAYVGRANGFTHIPEEIKNGKCLA